jgi:OmcA/MtrC family decaheme c-type cytochrome
MTMRLFMRANGRCLLPIFLILWLTGCGGGSSSNSSDSAEPPASRPALAAQSPLRVEVAGVTMASTPVLDFYLEDKNGVAVTDLLATDLQFTIAQLDPGADGNPSSWQNYKNERVPDHGVKAVTEKATEGTFVNHGNGSYTYTFAIDITKVTEPIAVPYDARRTHRIGMQFGKSVPVTNGIYTWQPATGATSAIASRDIVRTGSCNECHGALTAHNSNPRTETRLCVTCHAPGRADKNGTSIDFKVLIHKLHRGANLPSVVAGGSYQITGGSGTPHPFSDVAFPQDIRNCTKCHDGNDPATPDANNWQYRPSVEACGSCHDNVDFATGLNHKGGIASNAMCSDCHSNGGAAGPVATSHLIPAKLASAKFAYTITETTYDATEKKVTAKFKITDPSNGDAPYDLTEAVWSTSKLQLNVAWDSSEYDNAGANAGVAKALQFAFLNAGTLNTTFHSSYDAATGEHTVTSGALPVEAQGSGSGSVAIEGYPKVVINGLTVNTPVKSAVAYFAITDATARARRTVVDNAKCLKCHETLALHGNNRVNETAICVTCHNPNNTDIGMRGSAAGEESIDFKRMIHGIHAAGFRETGIEVYGHGNKPFDYGGLRFPGVLNNCKTCHTGTTYRLPLNTKVAPSVIDTGTDGTDRNDDLVITPIAAVCSSCHDKPANPPRLANQAHMESHGAQFGVDRATAAAAVELCANCHGPNEALNIDRVHGMD